MSVSKAPVAILTGFLGSGKTTLLNRWLRAPGMSRTVVVVNEFGEIGLDHELIEAADDSVVLLANGCLCCAMRGDLVRALDDVHRQRRGAFDRIVVETSGLAQPGPLIQLVTGEPRLRQRFVLDSVLATVDAVNAAATLAAHDEARQQVALADVVLVTKLDLAGAADLQALRAQIAALNPTAEVLDVRAAATPSGLLGRSVPDSADFRRAIDRLASASAAHDPARAIATFGFVREQPFSTAMLELFLRALGDNLGDDLLRVKGLLNVAGRPAVVHGAQHLLHQLDWLDDWPSDDRRTRLVFITQGAGRETVEELMAVVERIQRRGA